MKENPENSEKAVKYLLGDLSEAERNAMEERLFADEEFSLFLDSVENDLIDEYVRGEMNAAERQKFENSYLISERRREKIRAARILNEEVFVEKPQKAAAVAASAKVSVWQSFADFFRIPNIVWAGSLAAVILLMLIGGWWLSQKSEGERDLAETDNSNQPTVVQSPQIVVETPETLPQIAPLDANQTNGNQTVNPQKNALAEKPSPAKKEPEKREKREESVSSPPRVFAFTLLPPVRSGEKPVLKVPADAESLRLTVVHDNAKNFIKYRAEIRDSSGDLIWSREFPVSQKTLTKPIALNVRRGALVAGSYELTLSGITADRALEEINFYNFTVQKK